MGTLRNATLVSLLALSPAIALGQVPDAAAERARLGNERIQAEAERRAREEQEQQNRAAASAAPAPAAPAQAAPAQVAPAPSQAPTGPARPATGADLTERGLEQLRELGKLKDAGHLTEAEFQRIKQRILDAHF